jgi:hypothetical protein
MQNFDQTSEAKYKKPLRPRKKDPRRIKTAAQSRNPQRRPEPAGAPTPDQPTH